MLLSTLGIHCPSFYDNELFNREKHVENLQNIILEEEVNLSNHDKRILKEIIHEYLKSKTVKHQRRLSLLNVTLLVINISIICIFLGLCIPKIL